MSPGLPRSSYSLGSVDTFKGRGAWPLDSFAIAVFTLMLQFASKKSCKKETNKKQHKLFDMKCNLEIFQKCKHPCV